ncbi:hypothetical protein HG535_0C02820 [Zygotorulaspora mrakii]|uniref:Inositol polyphosphate-related phosphatase domain-containing protein n=1 Tax=Zygotorulaspora mrakii TaxID=42260 RepID=A0A7H9AZX8_ZYGMR|nr:uncharacterized protein HG535_0C02820 [Zygotorulaspora mrakii]QLG71930.1 hypothetical protein HG535_0C02820 [Zygotorulaspora mrakii]
MKEEKKTYITSFNCAKKFPFEDQDASSKILARLLPESSTHDVYALGFQELVSTWEASFPTVVKPLVEHLSTLALNSINSRSRTRKYEVVAATSTGAVALMVIADATFKVQGVVSSNYKCGLFNSSLKGSATVCCTLGKPQQATSNETFTFICSHLNANEGPENALLRVSNYREIMGSCALDLRSTLFKAGHVFFLGDLNFRVNGWHDMETDYSDSTILAQMLTNHEELNQLRKDGKVFEGFTESPITFPPTYKYLTLKQSALNHKRTPSWCDRVLYRKYQPGTYSCTKYESIDRFPELQFTDHQAVALDINVPAIAFDEPLVIEATVISSNQKSVGNIADLCIGYIGWFIYLRVYYGLLFGLALFILYKVF